MQILEEEKSKMDSFCEQSLKNVSVPFQVSHSGFMCVLNIYVFVY